MNYLRCLLAISFALSGCSASHYALATFSYNGNVHNALIVNRRPQYGDGQPDGCIITPALSLQLQAISPDSIVGTVHEAGTTQPVAYATIHISLANSTAAVPLLANDIGRFTISRAWPIKRISASLIGYRELTINLTDKRLY